MHKGNLGQLTLDNMRTGILLVDTRLMVLDANQAIEDLIATSKRRIIGSPLTQLIVDADQIESVATAVNERRAAGESGLSIQTRLGKTLTINISAVPVILDNRFHSIVIEMHPIALQQRINQEEQLINQHDLSRVVVKGLAHEIKNPLGGMRGAAQILQRTLPDTGVKECTDVIISEIDRLSSLVDRMLGPHTLPQMGMFNIYETLERVIKLVSMELPANIAFRRDYDPSIPDLYCDPELLFQAILNLVKNAVQAISEDKHMQSGQITLRTRTQTNVTVGHHRHRLSLKIDVIDNGPGIPADLLDKIFYPMVTRRDNGTGLGLSIAQSLINQHKGLIECKSKPGQTIFTVLLPMSTKGKP